MTEATAVTKVGRDEMLWPAHRVVDAMNDAFGDDERVDVVVVAFDYREVSLESLHVLKPFRRQGIGREVMDRLVREADAEDVRLYLEAVPVDAYASDIEPDALRDFYGEFAFEATDDEGEAFMTRQARAPSSATLPSP